MIIFRYLSREICGTLIAVTAILLLIFLSNQLVRYLDQAAAGRMAIMVLLKLMSLQVPQLLGLLLPLGLYLGLLLAYGRLYADHEMTILTASGLSRLQLLRLTLPVAVGVMLVVGLLTLWLSPYIAHYKDQFLADNDSGVSLQTLLPGHFQATADGQRIFYVESLSVDKKRMQHIFMAEQASSHDSHVPTVWNVLAASSGYQQLDPKTGNPYIVTTDGHRYLGIPGHSDYEIIDYGQYGVRIKAKVSLAATDEDAMSSWALLFPKHHAAQAYAELQWRLSMPLQVLLLTLLAIPLAAIKPRQGRYARLLPAIAIYIVYANFMFVARAWIEKGTISASLGMWWVHGLLLLVAIVLFPTAGSWQQMVKKLRLKQVT